MATYAIGDVQGCFAPLQALLSKIAFDPRRDQLWFTGDLVNRGPRSAQVLRFVKALGPAAVTVLGNHDLHLLAVAAGVQPSKPRDTLADILLAPDRDVLLAWLQARPLFHDDPTLGYALVHAGVLPQWDRTQARACAAEVEAQLRGPAAQALLEQMYGDAPDHWRPDLKGYERSRVIVNALTRIRYTDADGRMDLKHKGSPGTQPKTLQPWFQAPSRRTANDRIIFGHWSALGLWNRDGVIGLDTGCAWGRALTAVRLDDGLEFFNASCGPQENA